MKTGTAKPPRVEKPVGHPAKTQAKRPENLPFHSILDVWLTRPPLQPENLLRVLRNRSN